MKNAEKMFAALALVLLSAPVLAQNTATPRIDQRQQNQQDRIANGVRSGALTPTETRQLERREGKIAADERAAKADGKVTRAERAKLRREENRASRKIYQKKHNPRTAS